MKQRPIINLTDRAENAKFKSQGEIIDATGQDWTLQAFLKVRSVFGEAEPQVLNEWVKLTAR